MSKAPPALTVYYDASCPMCASEMRVLQGAAGAEKLKLVDCSAPDFSSSAYAATGVTQQAMMTKLHARDSSGRWLVALDAYEAIYRVAGFRRIAKLWGANYLRAGLDPVYLWVARHRNTISRTGLHRVFGWVLRR